MVSDVMLCNYICLMYLAVAAKFDKLAQVLYSNVTGQC